MVTDDAFGSNAQLSPVEKLVVSWPIDQGFAALPKSPLAAAVSEMEMAALSEFATPLRSAIM